MDQRVGDMGCAAQPIRDAQEAWRRLKEGQTFADWLKVGAALVIGRTEAMKEAQTNCPVGRTYAGAFGRWLAANKLADIDKSTRCRLFEVLTSRHEIEDWLATLESADRLKLNHPETVLKSWKRSTVGPQTRNSATKSEQLLHRWKKASVEERRRFLDHVSFSNLMDAMPARLRTEFQDRIIAQYNASTNNKAATDAKLTLAFKLALSTNRDGEALAALAAINRSLHGLGLDLHDVSISIDERAAKGHAA